MGRPRKDPADRYRRIAVFVAPAALRQLEIHAHRNGHPSASAFIAWMLNTTWSPQIKEQTNAPA